MVTFTCFILFVCFFILRKYQLVFCYTIIERNNRQFLPVIRSSNGGDSVQACTNPLDSFFPFDPYILKRFVFEIYTNFCLTENSYFKALFKISWITFAFLVLEAPDCCIMWNYRMWLKIFLDLALPKAWNLKSVYTVGCRMSGPPSHPSGFSRRLD